MIGIDIEPRGIGHRAAHHGAVVEPDLVGGDTAEIVDLGDRALEAVDGLQGVRVGRQSAPRDLDLFGADRDADHIPGQRLPRLVYADYAGFAARAPRTPL